MWNAVGPKPNLNQPVENMRIIDFYASHIYQDKVSWYFKKKEFRFRQPINLRGLNLLLYRTRLSVGTFFIVTI